MIQGSVEYQTLLEDVLMDYISLPTSIVDKPAMVSLLGDHSNTRITLSIVIQWYPQRSLCAREKTCTA